MKREAALTFTDVVIEFIQAAIQDHETQEVPFAGRINSDGIIYEVSILDTYPAHSRMVDALRAWQSDVLICSHAGADVRALGPDMQIASLLERADLGFYIIDNVCNQVNIICEAKLPVALHEIEIAQVFHTDALLAQYIPQFESRAEQVQLVQGIITAINQSEILLAEAGTGTGKSFAYLIPALVWAVLNQKRVLVSTHTILLQNQIALKDIPIVSQIVQDVTGIVPRSVVLVGRSNYLCIKELLELRRDHEKQNSLYEQADMLSILDNLEQWLPLAKEGTRNEWSQTIPNVLWEEISADTPNCPHRKCPYYGECFYYRSRAQAEESHLIIANHSLVTHSIDSSSFYIGLPAFRGVVFDEAHHLEEATLSALAHEFSLNSLLTQLQKVHRRKQDRPLGLLSFLVQKGGLQGHVDLAAQADALGKNIDTLCHRIQVEQQQLHTQILQADLPTSVTIHQDFLESPVGVSITQSLEGIFLEINQIAKHFDILAETLQTKAHALEARNQLTDLLRPIRSRIDRLLDSYAVFRQIFHAEVSEEHVRWLEHNEGWMRFTYSPLELGSYLNQALFEKTDFSILCSATLQVHQSFQYMHTAWGLPFLRNKAWQELALESPFNYAEQAELFILQEHVDHRHSDPSKIELIHQIALAAHGGALVLFTSYQRLNQAFQALVEPLLEAGLHPVRQGDRSRQEILQMIRSQSNVVLFATSSFWEGIDVSGDHVRCVIIEKLPFDHTQDPVYQAKCALIEARGGNPFMQYSVPRAILRLKQGFGRLIRSRSDRGIIVLLDNRLKTKRYGSMFLESLPPAKRMYADADQLATEAWDFFTHRFR